MRKDDHRPKRTFKQHPRPAVEVGGHGLARAISKLGFASRTEAAEMVAAGRVKLNGNVVTDPERRTFPGKDDIEVDGRRLRQREKVYLMMNKPAGVITTFKDPEGRPTVYNSLPKMDAWVFPVGRLDAKTSGLLIFTNDTEFGEMLTNSDYGVRKTYEVKVRGVLTDEDIEHLRRGVKLDDGYVTLPCECDVTSRNDGSVWLVMTIVEGKNRQIRRMVEVLGKEVTKLRRTRINSLELGDLETGKVRELTPEEVRTMASVAGLRGGRRSPRGGRFA